MSELVNLVVEEGLGMIPTLFILAEVIKETRVVDKRWIPLILIMFSMVLTPLLLGGYSAENVVQAFLVAGVPVLTHETWKNRLKKEDFNELEDK